MIVNDNPTQPRLAFCLPYSTLASILEPLSLPPHLASLIMGAWVAGRRIICLLYWQLANDL